MPKIIFLTIEEIELLHAGVLAKSGGLFGTRERSILEKLETEPKQIVFGKVLYPTLFEQASVYARVIILQHPFSDGNKRTGIISAFTFLEVNGFQITASNKDVYEFTLSIATQKLSITAITKWLRAHSRRRATREK